MGREREGEEEREREMKGEEGGRARERGGGRERKGVINIIACVHLYSYSLVSLPLD